MKNRAEEVSELLSSGMTEEQARDQLGLSKGYFRDIIRDIGLRKKNIKQNKYGWTKVGYRTDENGRLCYFHERDGLQTDWAAFNAPLGEISYPPEFVIRLQDALEGEMDGLTVNDESANTILRYVLWGRE